MNALVKSNVMMDLEMLDNESALEIARLIGDYTSGKYYEKHYSTQARLLESKLTNKQLQHITYHKFTDDDERQKEAEWYRSIANEYSEKMRNARIALQAMGLLSL